MFEENRFENLLKSLRVRKGKVWTQSKTATLLDVSLRTYVGWENGESLPSQRDLKNIAASFELNDTDTDILFHAAGRASPKVYTIPSSISTPFFTGRESILEALSVQLRESKTTILKQAISGLGGVGKTQIAVEYARLHFDSYRTVLWVNADSKEALIDGFVTLARQLMLPEKDEKDQSLTIEAVKRWLAEHSPWLFIFDNVEDLSLVNNFLPSMHCGHILLTTRSQAVGAIAQGLFVYPMELIEGTLLLLRRAKKIPPNGGLDLAPSDDRTAAEKIVEVLGGLPLALDQAGAYIEETGCSILDYLERYDSQRTKLLKRRGRLAQDHPESVSSTLSLSIEKVRQNNAAAIELLRLSAFLHPEAIPEKLIMEGMLDRDLELQTLIGDPIALDEAIETLNVYSLISRNASTKTFSVHRLVQAILRDEMNEDQQHQWAEQAVCIVERIFPDVEVTTWPICQQYILHAQTCATFIEKWNMMFTEASRLLLQAGLYLHDRMPNYTEIEPLYQRALFIREQIFGPNHLEVAQSLYALALLHEDLGKNEQAESLYQRALFIREQILGANHFVVAQSLRRLAAIYYAQGKYDQAEPLYQRALAIYEQALEPNHPDVAGNLNDLGLLYYTLGKYKKAEPLFQRALYICEQVLGPNHPEVSETLNNLALLYDDLGKYEQAEPLYQRALAIREQALGPKHPFIALSLNNLAALYHAQAKYEQAESLHQRALSIREQVLGSNHPDVAQSLNNLAKFYYVQGRNEEAEPLFQKALSIHERLPGSPHHDLGGLLHNLAALYVTQSKYAEAELFYQRSLSLWEQSLEPNHPNLVNGLKNYAALLRIMRREAEAIELETRAKAVEGHEDL